MATYPTKLAEAFASKAIEIYYATSVAEDITNQDYEGEIAGNVIINKINIIPGDEKILERD